MNRASKYTVPVLLLLMVMMPVLSGCADKSSDESTGIANPWSGAATLAEAAVGAGLDGFSVPEGSEISLGTVNIGECRYMDGLAEAVVEFPEAQMILRKGKAEIANEEGDVSGDYNEYANTWIQNIREIEVACYGNRGGDAAKTIWQADGVCYSINVLGRDGEKDCGLSADDLNLLISGIR